MSLRARALLALTPKRCDAHAAPELGPMVQVYGTRDGRKATWFLCLEAARAVGVLEPAVADAVRKAEDPVAFPQ